MNIKNIKDINFFLKHETKKKFILLVLVVQECQDLL